MSGLGLNLDALASRVMRKDFWTGFLHLAQHETDGARKFAPEQLHLLYATLQRNPVVNDSNRATVVETVRAIAEFMIWGDQHDPTIFEFLLENNVLVYLHAILQQNRGGDVAKQVLQTLSIIVQNLRSETGIIFLFSNNHLNHIVETQLNWEDEEVLGYYISFLKAISQRLDPATVQFFLMGANQQPPSDKLLDSPSDITTMDADTSSPTPPPRLPLYSEAIRLAHHREGMVRASVRTITLNVYAVRETSVHRAINSEPAAQYFNDMSAYLAIQAQVLDAALKAARVPTSQVLASLDSQLAEVEDTLSYCADVLSTAHCSTAQLLVQGLWERLISACLLPALQPHPEGAQHCAAPGALVSCEAALCILERMFCVLDHTPLLTNIVLALLGLWGPSFRTADAWQRAPQLWQSFSGTPTSSCRGVLLGMLRSGHPHVSHAAVRLLAAIVRCKAVDPTVLWAVGLPGRQTGSPPPSQAISSLCAMVSRHTQSSTPRDSHVVTQSIPYLRIWDIRSPPHAVSDASSRQLSPSKQQEQAAGQPLDTQPSLNQQIEEILAELVDATVSGCEGNTPTSTAGHVLAPAAASEAQAAQAHAADQGLGSSPQAPPTFSTDLLSALLAMVGCIGVPPRAVWIVAQLVIHCVQHLPPVASTAAASVPLYALLPEQQQQLTSALTQAATLTLDQMGMGWADAFFPLFRLEWAAAHTAITHMVLRAAAEQLGGGPYSLVHPAGSEASVAEQHGMAGSVLHALRLCECLQLSAALFQLAHVLQHGAPSATLPELHPGQTWHEVVEGQQAALTKAGSVPCHVCFTPPDPIRVHLTVAGAAVDVVGSGPDKTTVFRDAALPHSSPAVVLAQCFNNTVDTGVVVGLAPLVSLNCFQDQEQLSWLHVIVRPVVKSLHKLASQNSKGRGSLFTSLSSLAEGHWILSFQDASRCQIAIKLVADSSDALALAYRRQAGKLVNRLLDAALAL